MLIHYVVMYVYCSNVDLRCKDHSNQPVSLSGVTKKKGSPQADIKPERVGVVWAEFVTTLLDFLPTLKLN